LDFAELQTLMQMLSRQNLQTGGAADPLIAAAIGIGQIKVQRSTSGDIKDAATIETLQITLLIYVAVYRSMAITAKCVNNSTDSENFLTMSEYMQQKDAEYKDLSQELVA
jgi:hypothetical protein